MKLGIGITIVTVVALLCVTAVELYALSQGIDGLVLSGSIGAIVGIPTWFITRLYFRKSEGK